MFGCIRIAQKLKQSEGEAKTQKPDYSGWEVILMLLDPLLTTHH